MKAFLAPEMLNAFFKKRKIFSPPPPPAILEPTGMG